MAAAALAGIDPMRFARTRDPFEIRLMQQVAVKHAELQERRDQNLAVRIANEVGRLFGGR